MSFGHLSDCLVCRGISVTAGAVSLLPYKTFYKNVLMVAVSHLIWFALTTETAKLVKNYTSFSAASSEHASIGREGSNNKGD